MREPKTFLEKSLKFVFGTRDSLDLSVTSKNSVLIGDETSVGISKVFQQEQPDACLFYEANDLNSLKAISDSLGLRNTFAVSKKEGISNVQLKTKVYWADGKAGLD